MANSLDMGGKAQQSTPKIRLNKKQLSRERSVETILRSALGVFVQKGYRNTTIEQIAEASGLTKGAVYHYYESKEVLLLAVLDMVEQDVITEEELSRSDVPEANERLVAFIHAQGARALERADSFLFLVTLAGDLSNVGEEVGAKVDAILSHLGDTFQRIVMVGQKTGRFTRQVSAGDLTRLYISSFSGNVLLWHRSGRRDDIGRSLVRALRIACLSVLNHSAPPRTRRR
jgi:AcrR family transcriptional regulator